MTSSRPYLVRAIYDWLVDNQLTPYAMVDALYQDVEVPQNYVEDGKIILNIAPAAIRNLSLTNDGIRFHARFSGITHHVSVPMNAVLAVYAFENGRGMVFDEEGDTGGGDDRPKPPKGSPPMPPKAKGRPHLKVVK